MVLLDVSQSGQEFVKVRDVPVPVSFRVLVKRCEHNGQDSLNVVTDKVAEVLIVPEVERSFCNLHWS